MKTFKKHMRDVRKVRFPVLFLRDTQPKTKKKEGNVRYASTIYPWIANTDKKFNVTV